MIRTLVFWLIVAPASLAFVLGLIASVSQSMANKIANEQKAETLP